MNNQFAINMITSTLNQMGALFTIVTNDGKLHESSGYPPTTPVSTDKRRSFKEHNYQHRLAAMEVNETVLFEISDPVVAKSFQGTISGFIHRRLAPKQIRTITNGSTVIAVRTK